MRLPSVLGFDAAGTGECVGDLQLPVSTLNGTEEWER